MTSKTIAVITSGYIPTIHNLTSSRRASCSWQILIQSTVTVTGICFSRQSPLLRLWVFDITSFPLLCSTGTLATSANHIRISYESPFPAGIKHKTARFAKNSQYYSVSVYTNWYFRFEFSVLPRPLVRFPQSLCWYIPLLIFATFPDKPTLCLSLR